MTTVAAASKIECFGITIISCFVRGASLRLLLSSGSYFVWADETDHVALHAAAETWCVVIKLQNNGQFLYTAHLPPINIDW